jgi:hypothetical protein
MKRSNGCLWKSESKDDGNGKSVRDEQDDNMEEVLTIKPGRTSESDFLRSNHGISTQE